MKQKTLLTKLALLLVMLVGTGTVSAETVTAFSEDFNTKSLPDLKEAGWTFSNYCSIQSKTLQVASGSGAATATTPVFSSLNNSTATLTFNVHSSSSTTKTLTIIGNNCKVDGETSTTKEAPGSGTNSVTIVLTEASSSSSITFSAVKNGGCRIDNIVVSYVSGPAAPNFSVAAGNFSEAFNLTITGAEGTTLKYTTDGSDPANATATESNTATVSIPAATTTVRAIAIKDGVASEEVTATYTYVDASKEVPTFSLSVTELNLKVNDAGEITLTTNSDGTISFSCEDNKVIIDADDNYAIVSASAAGTYTVNVSVAESDTYQAASGTVTLNVTKKATTLTIDASAIGDTDIYTNTDDNLLGAIVKYGEAVVASATVTWASSNTAVATIDADGVVTLLNAGSTTITATYTGNDEYEGSSNTYELTVTYSEPYVQPLTVTMPLSNAANSFNCASGTDQTTTSRSFTQDRVTVTYNKGTGSQIYAASTGIRIYGGNNIVFEAPEGYNIVSVVLTTSSTDNLTTATGSYDRTTHTWTGAESSVTLSRPSGSGNVQTTQAVVTLALPSSIATPVITLASGTYYETKTTTITCETSGATIFYTLDDTTPTAESTEYTGTICINESCTLKAIAIKDDESSAVASATYTIELPYTTITEVKALTSGTSFRLNLTGAQIVYFDDSKNMYVRDASGAILFYNSSSFSTSLKTGDILSGIVTGTYTPYNGLPEVTNSDISGITATSNEVVVAKTIAGTTEAMAANLCDLVKIENTEITLSNSKYYVGDNSAIQLYDGLHIGITFDEGDADVQGIATVYNTTYELFPRYESDIVYLDNAVSVAIGEAGMATFSSNKALDFTGVDAIAAYYATVNEGKVTFTRIRKVPANTGLLLCNAEGEEHGAVSAINVPVLGDETEAESTTDNALVAVATTIDELPTTDGITNNYILNKKNGVLGFYRAANKKVAAGKAYLAIPVSSGSDLAREFIGFNFDDTTGITETSQFIVDGSQSVYNLNGQRVNSPKSGLYIVNGKKVIMK